MIAVDQDPDFSNIPKKKNASNSGDIGVGGGDVYHDPTTMTTLTPGFSEENARVLTRLRDAGLGFVRTDEDVYCAISMARGMLGDQEEVDEDFFERLYQSTFQVLSANPIGPRTSE